MVEINSHQHQYVYNSKTHNRRLNRGAPVACFICQKPLQEGDVVFSRASVLHSRIYHYKCWKRTFV